MINGFPEITQSFLAGQSIFYSQFNDIEFYVEDLDQEHLYYNILKRLFSDVKFEKIFPLNGKDNVKDAAKRNLGDKSKVFIVDLDFDSILNRIEIYSNLFYLNKYSIENYLIEKEHLYEIVRLKNPKLKNMDIDGIMEYSSLISSCIQCLKELTCAFIIISNFKLGIEYYGICTSRDFVFNGTTVKYRMSFIASYFTKIEQSLNSIDKRYRINSQIKKYMSRLSTFEKSLTVIPGKYLLTVVKDRLIEKGLIFHMTDESFMYALSKEFSSDKLDFLKERINNYIR